MHPKVINVGGERDESKIKYHLRRRSILTIVSIDGHLAAWRRVSTKCSYLLLRDNLKFPSPNTDFVKKKIKRCSIIQHQERQPKSLTLWKSFTN